MKIKSKIAWATGLILLSAGIVMAGIPPNVQGTVIEVNEGLVIVETPEGDIQAFQVDKTTTRKGARVAIGTLVSADVNDRGHANWISVMLSKDTAKTKLKDKPKG